MPVDWTLILFIAVIGLLLWYVLRGRKRTSPHLQVVLALISNINDDLGVAEAHRLDPQSTRKFKEGAWKSYQDNLEFLDAPTVNNLKSAFSLMREFNEKIDTAKKTRSTASLQELPLDKLKEPLAAGKEGLVAWLRSNLQTEMKPNWRRPWGF